MDIDRFEKQAEIVQLARLIEIKPVASSNILGIGYDEGHQLLKVAFRNKDSYNTYVYENVEPEVYSKIAGAESVGTILRECVINNKEKYNYIKL